MGAAGRQAGSGVLCTNHYKDPSLPYKWSLCRMRPEEFCSVKSNSINRIFDSLYFSYFKKFANTIFSYIKLLAGCVGRVRNIRQTGFDQHQLPGQFSGRKIIFQVFPSARFSKSRFRPRYRALDTRQFFANPGHASARDAGLRHVPQSSPDL